MEAPEGKAAGRPHKVVVRWQEALRRVALRPVERRLGVPLRVALRQVDPQRVARRLVALQPAGLRVAALLQAALPVAPLVAPSAAARRRVVRPVALR